MKHSASSTRLLVTVATVALLALTGCSSSADNAPNPSPNAGSADQARPTAEFNKKAAALVPQDIAKAGVLQVATTIGMAPLGYPDEKSGQLAGFNIDIMNEIGDVLGLKVEMHGATMDQIIPGIQAGRYDATASNMAITPERQKVLDFVQYYFASSSLATKAGNPEKITVDNLCGKSVGVSNGSFQQTSVMPAKSEACQKAGKKPLDVQSFPDQQKAVLALSSGRLDTVAGDTPVLLYAANLNKQIEVGDKLTAGSIVGIGMDKGSPLVEAVSAAMNDLIDSGTYKKTLDVYGIGDLGIDHSEIKK